MACSKQSAKDYIANARVYLVGELRNLSVILENLYQQKVLTDEEVSKIKAEKDDYDRTRAILDSVTRKGEAACYRFLRIIDQTRRRTLERPTPIFKISHEASTEATKFDLHHWISCFSFTEDPETDQNYIQGNYCHVFDILSLY
uniref:CARD domain-containing protein n=1 Tax=Xiphophorus couchianus TaxID=32473 RepID=A0A3B5MSI3_9TELE